MTEIPKIKEKKTKMHKTKMLVLTTIVTCLCLSSLIPYAAGKKPVYITGVTPVPDFFSVPFYTPWEDAVAVLPPTTTITVSKGKPISVTLDWNTTYPWFRFAYGNYMAVGTFELPEGVCQPDPPIPLQVTTTLRMESGRGLMRLDWEGFYQPGTYVEAWMIVGGLNRTYYYYVPTSYDGSEPVPLVFDFHGGWSNGLAEWSSTRSDRVAEKEGFISVAPSSYIAGFVPSLDFSFVSAIIDTMETQYNIDSRRIYAYGISGGSVFSTQLAYDPDLSDKFAAVGLVSGPVLLTSLLEAGQYPPRPMTVVFFGGTRESITGGPVWWDFASDNLACAELLVQEYHCDPEPEITEWSSTDLDLDNLPYWTSVEDALLIAECYPTSVTRYVWSGGIYGTEVIAYGILDGGHCWPGGNQFVTIETVGRVTYVIDATELLWEHLSKHALPEQVDIDIKPSTFPNNINPTSQGVTPVAILTTNEFDATTVDVQTVSFGPAFAKPVHYALEDVDKDGDIDMILHFRTQETGIQAGDTSATLTGRSFFGTDSIVTI